MNKNITTEVKGAMKARKSLKISRIPMRTLDAFKHIAQENFCNDYGMTLKKCVDSYKELKDLKKLIYEKGIRVKE